VSWPCATSQIVSRLVKYQLEFIISVSIARLIIKVSHDFALQHPKEFLAGESSTSLNL
jgi:hypothetical protein